MYVVFLIADEIFLANWLILIKKSQKNNFLSTENKKKSSDIVIFTILLQMRIEARLIEI